MMSAPTLANATRSDMGFPLPVSTQLTGWASAVVTEIQTNAKVNHSVVTGTCPDGGPLANGAASNGLISGLQGPRLATAVAAAAGYPGVSSELTKFSAQIVSHIHILGRVTFASGTITGSCPGGGGPLSSGAGTNGTVVSLSGSTLASAIHSAVGYPGGVSTRLTQFCTALVNHIMTNARVTYASGSVTGSCGGGTLSSGVGANGTIA